MSSSRIILRNLALALAIIAVFVVIITILSYRFMNKDNGIRSFRHISVTKEPITIETTKEPEVIPRYIIDKHVVVGGESFSIVTSLYWDDYFLWPDLYMQNEMKSGDPDLIFPNEVIDIYNRLGSDNHFTEKEKTVILDAYIEVYKLFKAIGTRKNSSAWILLWCAAKYDRDFLSKYSGKIEPADIKKVQLYIDEEGYLD